jgi:ribosomal protein S18 acetylase RimI-like enzyme
MDIIIKSLSKDYLERNIDEFINILKEFPYEYWNKKHFLLDLPRKFDLSLYALKDNMLVGYIIASQKEDYAYIHKFMVRNEFRSFGIGGKLQQGLEHNSLSLMLYQIRLAVYDFNKKAISFYLKHNYKVIGKRFDRDLRKLLVMNKKLQ